MGRQEHFRAAQADLVDRLTPPAPNDDAENDDRQNPRDDSNQGNVIHVCLLFLAEYKPNSKTVTNAISPLKSRHQLTH
jgi:hypothetical protein